MHKHLDIGEDLCFVTSAGEAFIVTNQSDNELTVDELGKIAEWLAVAWENLCGDEYKPVVITENGYVAQEGVVHAGEYVIPKSAIGNSLDSIKKRAAALPLFADKLERDCE